MKRSSRKMWHMAACLAVLSLVLAAPVARSRAAAQPFSLDRILDYPFPEGLTVDAKGDRIAWVINQDGVRNVWVADAPDFKPQRVTRFPDDDGQELTQLTFSPDGDTLVFVRGGDHDANWPHQRAPNPAHSTAEPEVTLWAVAAGHDVARPLTAGDAPAISSRGELAYIKDHQVWAMALGAGGAERPKRLFYDRGSDGGLHWSPDGRQLAFVSRRGDHAFIGVYSAGSATLQYIAPSIANDTSPRWSPDGTRLAFIRLPGAGGPPPVLLKRTRTPWSIWVADVRSGRSHAVWKSPDTLNGSFPGDTRGSANLHWADSGQRLVFVADIDGWPHLYSTGLKSGDAPLLLTPGNFMVEDVALARDGRSILYNANTGTTRGDSDRRHLFMVPVAAARPRALTSGTDSQWSPVDLESGQIAYLTAGAQVPPQVVLMGAPGAGHRVLQPKLLPADFPTSQLIAPRLVSFHAPDGTLIHGQLFRSPRAAAAQPGIVFVHGGPMRQMLLGWHYSSYYANSYAVNQYLATHGFTVLSVDYRLGIGHGHAFEDPPHAGAAGAAEYQDVLAGAKWLQQLPGVDPARIGIWGGSYGGYLTALALARNSDVFKAGVDMHGMSDLSRSLAAGFMASRARYEQGDFEQAMRVAWQSSPDASIAKWTSPVLLIQGDDDHNVHFAQLEDLVPRLRRHHVPHSVIVFPDEIHVFLRYATWLRADKATVEFFAHQLRPAHSPSH